MVKKVVRAMTPTCTVQTPSEDCICRRAGFTITELVVVLVIVSMFAMLAVTNFSAVMRSSTFKAQIEQFVSTMQMAATTAAESDRRYEVIIDLIEQRYILRQITSPDIEQVLDEEIIVDSDFGDKCLAVFVIFDDLVGTSEDFQVANFRVGHNGWQNGGKIVLLDPDENPYSVIVDRISRTVVLKKGDVEILLPKREDELSF